MRAQRLVVPVTVSCCRTVFDNTFRLYNVYLALEDVLTGPVVPRTSSLHRRTAADLPLQHEPVRAPAQAAHHPPAAPPPVVPASPAPPHSRTPTSPPPPAAAPAAAVARVVDVAHHRDCVRVHVRVRFVASTQLGPLVAPRTRLSRQPAPAFQPLSPPARSRIACQQVPAKPVSLACPAHPPVSSLRARAPPVALHSRTGPRPRSLRLPRHSVSLSGYPAYPH